MATAFGRNRSFATYDRMPLTLSSKTPSGRSADTFQRDSFDTITVVTFTLCFPLQLG